MRILGTKVLRGPNYWSNYRCKLIVMKLDLEEFENFPTDLLPGFAENLEKLIPSLYSHRCSRDISGGFLQRLKEGTWLGHVIEHIALELQTLAGMDCGFGRTFGMQEEGLYQVIFSYEFEEAGLYSAQAAFNIADNLANGRPYEHLQEDLSALTTLYEREKFGPSTEAIVKEAIKRNIPFFTDKNSILVSLGYGVNQKKIWATVSSQTSSIGVDIASDKELTKKILTRNYIPAPKGLVVHNLDELDQAIKELEFPLVIKPLNGNHGRGITTNIQDKERALTSFLLAQTISEKVIVEHFIKGWDYRFLVVNYKVVAVAHRTPAMVIGKEGKTINELIIETNQNPLRGKGHSNYLTTIEVDDSTLSLLLEKNLSLDSVLPEGEILYLKDSANLSTGGTAEDVTDSVHPFNIKLAERIAKLIELDICGIDLISSNIHEPLTETTGAIIEVNSGPGIRMHLAPSAGTPRNIAVPILDMLFPKKDSWKIPLIAVTGTNGKTTVVRLIAHLAQDHGYHVGFTTTDGIYINNECIYTGDCSGPVSAQVVLQDPSVDFAVLECARGGILRSGLGFTHCDISIITNITEDHLGLNDIHTIEELRQLKSVVAHSTYKNGYAILNADNDLVYSLKEELRCKIALFSLEKNKKIVMHFESGGLGIYFQDGFIILFQDKKEDILCKVDELPFTFNGTAPCMIANLLPAILAAIISGFSKQAIHDSLLKFSSSYEITPGRMNLFKTNQFQVLLDYAHNEGAYIELKKYINSLSCSRKIGIIGAVGDRKPQDIEKLGTYSALMFDEIIIRHNEDGRGRSNEELTNLLMNGISKAHQKPQVTVISDQLEALQYAFDHSTPNSFIFCSVDDVNSAIEYTKKALKL